MSCFQFGFVQKEQSNQTLESGTALNLGLRYGISGPQVFDNVSTLKHLGTCIWILQIWNLQAQSGSKSKDIDYIYLRLHTHMVMTTLIVMLASACHCGIFSAISQVCSSSALHLMYKLENAVTCPKNTQFII